jgi:uroporphyrinogen-III synthase
MALSGIKVLVTRPVHQSEPLCKLIAAEGGQAIRLPVIEIVEMDDKKALLDCRELMDDLDIAIFISANAVEKTLPTLLAHFSSQLQLFAVGKRTTEILKNWGLTVLCPAPPSNSEALLEMPQLQSVQGKNIVIFRGEGGRELLAETLRQRGALVNYVNVYRRIQPPAPAWITQVDIITVTSVEGLRHLLMMLEKQAWVRHTPLVVMSKRIRAEAEKLGIQAPIFVAPTASDEGLLMAIQEVDVINPVS